jgi:tRNA pseudouridine55 synthase
MDAVVNIDKPKGPTSQDVVTRVKRILGVPKAGHAGTLDPLATGVLLVCTGEATKAARFLMDEEKEYVVEMRLGERTETLDAEGAVIASAPGGADVPESRFRAAMEGFLGEIEQVPPMYSALKVGGRALHEIARRGGTVERAPRTVRVRAIELLGFAPPSATISIICSKGTYVRTLVDDLGAVLGTYAHVRELRRTRVGRFTVEGAVALDDLSPASPAITPLSAALSHLRTVRLGVEDARRVAHGVAVKALSYGSFVEREPLLLVAPDGALLAIGVAVSESLRVERGLGRGKT